MVSENTTSAKPANLSPATIGVKTIATSELRPNPHNPRMLFDREPLAVLRESIAKVGILVPLTVYLGRGHKHFTILDGQRRWMCAQELGLPTVPVNQVAEPTLVQNIVTMFQIHKLRQDWELMPTALKLEVLMDKLRANSDKRLAELTGLDQAVVARCKKLLSYSSKYQNLMLDPDPEKRVKADFFIELYAVRNDRVVTQMPWFKRDKFTRRMLEKYQNPKSDLKAVTDFRLMKQHINNARKAHKIAMITKRLEEYVSDNDVPMTHLAIRTADVVAGTRKLLKAVAKLEQEIDEIDAEEYFGQTALWAALERLANHIRRKLSEADRRPQP